MSFSFSKVFRSRSSKGKQNYFEILLKAPFKVSPTGKDHHSSTLLYLSKNRVRFFFFNMAVYFAGPQICAFIVSINQTAGTTLFSQPTFRGLKTHPDERAGSFWNPRSYLCAPHSRAFIRTGAGSRVLAARWAAGLRAPVVNTFPGVAHTFSRESRLAGRGGN